MIQITPQMRVLVATDPVDGRKGIDSLAALCRERLQACLLYTSPSPRDRTRYRMPSSA